MFGRPPTPTQGAVSFPGSPRVFICGTEWSVRPVVSLNQPAVLMCPRANRGRNHLHLCGREPISKEARGVLSPSATVGLLLPEREKPITPLWVLNALCWSGRTWRSLFHPRFPLFLFFFSVPPSAELGGGRLHSFPAGWSASLLSCAAIC